MPDSLPAPDPSEDPQEVKTPGLTEQGLVQILAGYRSEAENARSGGLNPRDQVWESNWNLYWGRYDFSKKASWQSKIVMPEAGQFIDRWAAAMKEALVRAGEWYEVEDDTDQNEDLVPHVKKFMNIYLSRCGRTPQGHVIDFAAVFEECMKLAAVTAGCAAVVPKQDDHGYYTAVEAVDPRSVWLDPQGRNLYRIRRLEIDKHELVAMAKQKDGAGRSIYKMEEIQRLAASLDEQAQTEKETSAGHGVQTQASSRKPIELREFLCTILDDNGDLVAENALVVVANGQFIIRGPEDNPFWHRKDWIVYAPLISVPFSVYGKSYMENWSSVAHAFTEMTNLIMDATFTSAMKAYAACGDMLKDPTELAEGIWPNKIFQLEDGSNPKDFMKEIDLGTLAAEAITVWQSLKTEMREGSLLNEVALGQLAPGDKTATEISTANQQGGAFTQSLAESVEKRFLEPILTLFWSTCLQHTDFADPQLARELGEETAMMLGVRKNEFRDRRFRFRVTGLSALVKRSQQLRSLMAVLALVGSNEILLGEFMKRFDPAKLVQLLFVLHGVDTKSLELSERERAIRSLVDTMNRAAPSGPSNGRPSPNASGAALASIPQLTSGQP